MTKNVYIYEKMARPQIELFDNRNLASITNFYGFQWHLIWSETRLKQA